jgi:hypothetical protein
VQRDTQRVNPESGNPGLHCISLILMALLRPSSFNKFAAGRENCRDEKILGTILLCRLPLVYYPAVALAAACRGS